MAFRLSSSGHYQLVQTTGVFIESDNSGFATLSNIFFLLAVLSSGLYLILTDAWNDVDWERVTAALTVRCQWICSTKLSLMPLTSLTIRDWPKIKIRQIFTQIRSF